MPLPGQYYDEIADMEGYYQKPYWDYKQWSWGHGTRAPGPNARISREDARKELIKEVNQAENNVLRWAKNNNVQLNEGQRAALTSLTYNSGAKWQRMGLGRAVKRGDWQDASRRFGQYNKAGGKYLQGLQNRRMRELGWLSNTSVTPAGGQTQSVLNDLTDPPANDQARPLNSQVIDYGPQARAAVLDRSPLAPTQTPLPAPNPVARYDFEADRLGMAQQEAIAAQGLPQVATPILARGLNPYDLQPQEVQAYEADDQSIGRDPTVMNQANPNVYTGASPPPRGPDFTRRGLMNQPNEQVWTGAAGPQPSPNFRRPEVPPSYAPQNALAPAQKPFYANASGVKDMSWVNDAFEAGGGVDMDMWGAGGNSLFDGWF